MAAKKLRLLAWCDSPGSDMNGAVRDTTTGFGQVSKWILGALEATGKYDITILGINHFQPSTTWKGHQIIPAKWLGHERDVYGYGVFQQLITEQHWDLVFVINDLFVVEEVWEGLASIKNRPKIIYYFPVDCTVQSNRSHFLEVADFPVAYTKWAKDEAVKVYPHLKDIPYIYHGVDTRVYRFLSKETIKKVKTEVFGEKPPFIITTVNRNNVRKNLTQLIWNFAQFKKIYKNSVLNLHTAKRDHGINLDLCCQAAGLDLDKDIHFPSNYNTVNGYPAEAMNSLWNMSDMCVTTNRGEGYGLMAIESLAAGCPLIVPDHTIHKELWQGKAWLYPAKEHVYVEDSGHRLQGRDEDITKLMLRVASKIKKNDPEVEMKRQLGRQFAEENDWRIIGQKWVKLFSAVEQTPLEKLRVQKEISTGEEV